MFIDKRHAGLGTEPTPAQRRAPGPRGLPLLGVAHHVRNDPLGFSLRMAREYGGMVAFKLATNQVFMMSRPEYFQHILVDNYRNYHKSAFYQTLRPIFGNGLVTSEGETWKRQRQLAQPSFHRKRLDDIARGMAGEIGAMLDGWGRRATRGEPVDVAAEAMELALGNIAHAMFGTDVRDEFRAINRDIAIILRRAEQRIWSPLTAPAPLPTPANLRSRRATAGLDRIVYRVIRERRETGEDRLDLLSMLLAARYEDTGEGMTDEELRDMVLTILVAGHETVGTAAAIVYYLVSKHPDVEARLTAEVDAVLGGRTPTFADLHDLPYVGQVVQEALRLYPSAWTISRQALADDAIDGVRIPAGATTMLSPYIMHRNPEFWDNPEAFDPSRFEPEQVARRPKHAYVPFGGGPRTCIGANFALTELKLLLAMTCQRFRMQLVPGCRLVLEPMISLRPSAPLTMTLRAREP